MTSSQSYSCELVVFYPHPCTPHSVNSIQQTYYLGFLHIPKDLFSLPKYQNEYNLYMKKKNSAVSSRYNRTYHAIDHNYFLSYNTQRNPLLLEIIEKYKLLE